MIAWWGGAADPLGLVDQRANLGYWEAYAYAIIVSAYPFAKAISSPYIGYWSLWPQRRAETHHTHT